jgi:hypothetical protein
MCKSEIFAGAIGKNFNRQELKRASEDEIYMQRWNLCRGLSAKVSKGKSRAYGFGISREPKGKIVFTKF